MNEISINPINSVRLADAGAPVKSIIPEKTQTAILREPITPNSDKPTKPAENESDQAGNVSNVSIHFKVDDETKQLTVFVVDKRSKRVIRTIPASELSKLQAGDLLKLTA